MKLDGAALWYFAAIDLWFGDEAVAHAETSLSECARAGDDAGVAMWLAFADAFESLREERRTATRAFAPSLNRPGRRSMSGAPRKRAAVASPEGR